MTFRTTDDAVYLAFFFFSFIYLKVRSNLCWDPMESWGL